MIRDFSDDEREKLQAYAIAEENANFSSIENYIYDRMTDIDVSDLDISDYIDDIDNYHKQLIDAENLTSTKIGELFDAVHSVDENTVSSVDLVKGLIESIGNTIDSLAGCIEIGNYKSTGKPLALSSVDYKEKLENEVPHSDADALVTVYKEYRNGNYEAVQDYIDKLVEELPTDVREFGEEGPKSDLKIKEEMVVNLNNMINPEYAEGFTTLFYSGSEPIKMFDQINIMFIVYTADEPFKSLFLESLGSYSLGTVYTSTKNDYDYEKNVVNLKSDAFIDNSKGAYVSFFHECGHAIDFNTGENQYFSLSYINDEGKTLQDDIYYDVSDNVTKVVNNYASGQTSEHIIDYILGADNSKINDLTDTEKAILSDVQDYYGNAFCGAVNEAASDVYGGVTNNIIYSTDNYGHTKQNYWYKNGMATGNQSAELWAEYYSYSITGKEDALNSLEDNYTEAGAFLNDLATAMTLEEN